MIMSGGKAADTSLRDGGYLHVSNGGVQLGAPIYSSGRMYISSGGVANDTTVNHRGTMYIYSGGTANSTTVNGYMDIYSGGVHKGCLQIESRAFVSACTGSIIDFTVSGRTVKDDYLINDLSRISGTPTYTITVSANQADGMYKLAQGAENFTGSITVAKRYAVSRIHPVPYGL